MMRDHKAGYHAAIPDGGLPGAVPKSTAAIPVFSNHLQRESVTDETKKVKPRRPCQYEQP